jgi:hypothetical protein
MSMMTYENPHQTREVLIEELTELKRRGILQFDVARTAAKLAQAHGVNCDLEKLTNNIQSSLSNYTRSRDKHDSLRKYHAYVWAVVEQLRGDRGRKDFRPTLMDIKETTQPAPTPTSNTVVIGPLTLELHGSNTVVVAADGSVEVRHG